MPASKEERLKALLRRDNVKLWEPPHTAPDLTAAPFPPDFVRKYATALGASVEEAQRLLDLIRESAVERLRARRRFEESGTARLYFRLNGEQRHVDTRLDEPGASLYATLAGIATLEPDGFRLIVAGRVLSRTGTLESQGVGNLGELLLVEETESDREATWLQEVERARRAATTLVEKGSDHLGIRDQEGRKLDLPKPEQLSLTVAMTLQEKGRRALTKRLYARALLFFLEADREFKACRSQLLQAVDNYSLLSLDIVWCYLKLNSVRHLPDAARLKECEAGFKHCYGPNLERVARLKVHNNESLLQEKGGSLQNSVDLEKGLILRLKLLQGILAFYKLQYTRAKSL